MQSDVTHLTLQDQLLTWFEKNKRQVVWGAVALAVIGVAIGIYFWHQDQAESDASKSLSLITAGTQPPATDALLKFVSENSGSEAARRALLLAAGNLFAEGKFKDAQAQFEHFLRDYRDSSFAPEALLGVAACKEAQGMTNDAVNAYKDIVDHHPNESVTPQAMFSLARLYQAQGKLELARDNYEKVAQMDPNGTIGSQATMELADLFAKNPSLVPARPAAASTPSIKLSKP
jgi:TolA-binding protein